MSAPTEYSDIIGQQECVSRLRAFVDFYRSNGSTPEHILLVGADGMGKRTISAVVPHETGVAWQELDTSALEIRGDLTAVLTNLRENQVLIIPDLSRLRRDLQTLLAQACRERQLTISIGQGPAARPFTIGIKPFTLIATVKRLGDCVIEFQRCFSLVLTLQAYNIDELQEITDGIAKRANLDLAPEAGRVIALNSKGCPAEAELLLSRVAGAVKKQHLEAQDVLQALEIFGIRIVTPAQAFSVPSMQMTGIEFERFVTAFLTQMEFRAEMTKTTGDGGIDIVAFLDKPIIGGKYLFQCKRYATDNLVGAATVREFYGAVTAEKAVKGVLITTSGFTAQAREFAEKVGIEVIDLAALKELLDGPELRIKRPGASELNPEPLF